MSDFFIAKAFDSIIGISKKKGLQYLKNSLEFNKLIKMLGLSAYIEDSYASDYIRTLLILEDSRDYREFIPLLKEKGVFESFIQTDKKGDREIFHRELNSQLHTNPNLRALKKFDCVPTLLVSEFLFTFDQCREDTWTPNEVQIQKRLEEIDNNAEFRHQEIKSKLEKFSKILQPQTEEIINYGEKISRLTRSRIDTIFENIKKGNVDSGLENLQNLKEDIWTDIDIDLKNSLLKKIAYCYLEKRDWEHAIQFYEEALALKKDASTYSILSVLYHRNDDQQKLKTCLKDFDTFDSQKSDLTRLRFGISLKKPEDYLELVVSNQTDDEETIISILQYYTELKDHKKAFEIGCLLIDKYDKVEYKEFVSEQGILYLQTRGIHLGINYVDANDKILFKKGLEFTISYCDYFIDKEIIKYKSYILNYRGIYEMWNGNYELSLRFINQAVSIEPDNFQIIKTLGSVYSKQGKYKEVIDLFEFIPQSLGTEDIPLMKSVCYFALGNVQDAITTLRSNIEWINSFEIKERTLAQLINYFFFSDEVDSAKETFEKYLDCFAPQNKTLIESKILISQGCIDQAKTLLVDLKNDIIGSLKFSSILPDLGMELEKIGDFESVIDLYECFSNYFEETFFLKSLYDLYVKTGRLSKAIEICEAQRAGNIHKFYTRNEIAIFYNYKDYDRVIELGKKYIDAFPDNIEIRLHLVYSLLKRDNKFLAKEYLKYQYDITNLDEHNARNLIDHYLKLNLKEEAFEVAYKLLAYHHQDVSFNDLYMLVSIHNDEFMTSIEKSQISPDATVVIDENSEIKVITFVNGISPDYQKKFYNEERIDDSKYQYLFGKTVGDIVEFSYQNEEYKIEVKEIKHRYVHAFHIAIQRCGTSFKEASGFKMLDASPLKSGQLPELIKNNLLESEKAAAGFEDFLQEYKAGKIPLVSIAVAFKHEIIDVWDYCTFSPKHVIRVGSGNLNEFEAIIPYLESTDKNELLLDITSLLLMKKIGGLDAIKKHFSVFVLQDVIDYLDDYISLNSIGIDNESSTLHRANGENFLLTHSSEEKREKIVHLESFKNWVKANFKIMSPDMLLNIDHSKLNDYVDLFGPITGKGCLISGNTDIIFLCDDLAMRNFFSSEFRKTAVWTQSIFNFLMHKEFITTEEYNVISQKLVGANVFYTHINSDTLYEMFYVNNFEINKTSLKFLNILRGNISDNSAFIVAFDFLKKIWSANGIEIVKMRRITYETILSLFISRCSSDVYRYIKLLTNVSFENSDIRLEIRNQLDELRKVITING